MNVGRQLADVAVDPSDQCPNIELRGPNLSRRMKLLILPFDSVSFGTRCSIFPLRRGLFVVRWRPGATKVGWPLIVAEP